MSKPFIFGVVMGLGLLTVAGIGASRQRDRDAEQVKPRSEIAQYRAELADATPVRLGALTEKERVHSKLYAEYYAPRTNTRISKLLDHPKGKVLGIELHVGLGELLTEPVTPEDYFGELAYSSDAVIRGRVTNKASHITEDDSFLFTDYDILVTEIFKGNSATPINIGATITVTRPGGKIVVDGVIVKVIDDAFAPLPLNSHDVVLFLKYVRETGAYRATRDTGSFELDGSSVRPLTGVQFPPNVLQDGAAFLQTARAVSSK